MRLPDWIKTDTGRTRHLFSAAEIHSTKSLLRGHRLSTVCEEARCPNRPYCFSKPTATFMILGDACTRDCAFCSVSSGTPSAVDLQEPERVADAARAMGLRHVVITSVARDDIPDGGASHFAAVIRALREGLPDTRVEVLTPDFSGNIESLKTVIGEGPDVFNHNMETVRRLYPSIRPQADYVRSLQVLLKAKEINPDIRTKSGFMLGLGETMEEVMELLRDLRSAGCDALTIGQYLRPTKKNHPVVEYIIPRVFDDLKEKAAGLGFAFVTAAPLARSSMNAEEMYYRGG